jgi:glutamate dehydrogenase
VRHCYVTYIEALLDLTDDRAADGTIRHPAGVRVHDGDDAYLVVAADKGTASFSDTANAVALRRGFWLGDAFASGGSTGYDHKALGITARGAWTSVERHFRELGRDPAGEPFTVVGIGDMSGDVFGNAMLLSDRIRLVAAYDHRHVFLDPDPDPEAGFAERRRLFELPGSTWDDYDRSRISAGGGVFPRTAKSISLTPEVRAALGVDDDDLTPTDLIRAILRAPVDLLFNGGIGTVVKASAESHGDAQDRSSDAIRVDGRELRCKVVGEGGNLGLTQRARIEFARAGGRINADFIDNSAGVDCSDHEVNLKVLLDVAVARGELSREDRNALLREVTDDVTRHVLHNSFLQAQILAQEVRQSPARMFAFEDLMALLEQEGGVDRAADALPVPEEMAERRRAGAGMLLPELAVLLAHAKLWLTDQLLSSELLDDPELQDDLRAAFPPAVVERFGDLVAEHPLRREILATRVANDCVDALGPTWVPRLVAELGVEPGAVVRAYRVARTVTAMRERWDAIEGVAPALDPETGWALMGAADELVEAIARWELQHRPQGPITEVAASQSEGFARLAGRMGDLRSAAWCEEHEAVATALRERGVPAELARMHAHGVALVHAPDIVLVADRVGRDVLDVACAFFELGDGLRLEWLEREVDALPAGTRMQRWAVQAVRDDVLAVRRELALRALEQADGAPARDAVHAFLRSAREPLGRLQAFTRALALENQVDLAGLTLAVRQLRALAAPPSGR